MIAAIRVRYTTTPEAQVWNDAMFSNWLNPTIQYSLAHFWHKSSFGQADLKFQIFPTIVIEDPKLKLKPEERNDNNFTRPAIVNASTAKVTELYKPDWNQISGVLIWFAQPTDLFGGGAYTVAPNRELPVAVCDIASPYDSICQELGHAYGFDHQANLAGADYGSPYDSMSAQTYNGFNSANWQRPVDRALPVGVDAAGNDPQRWVGPYLSPAQTLNSDYKTLVRAAGMVVDVPPSFENSPFSFTLYALDDAIDRFPGDPKPMVAVIPANTPYGDTFYLELRRSWGYDSGLRKNADETSSPPVGVVIHSKSPSGKQIVYHDVLALADERGDRDYHQFGRDFIVRVNRIGVDYRSVGLTIGGRQFWRHFGVDIDTVKRDIIATSQSPWRMARASPCFMFPVDDYYCYYEYNHNRYTVFVSSMGYEKPGYVWTVNGTVLDPAGKKVNISTSVDLPGPSGNTVTTQSVPIEYKIRGDRLELSSKPEIGNFSLVVEVQSSETSPEVLKNFYEDRTVVTSVPFENVKLHWDGHYKAAQKACGDKIKEMDRKRTPKYRIPIPEPGERFLGRVRAVIYQAAAITLGVISVAADTLADVLKIIGGRGVGRR